MPDTPNNDHISTDTIAPKEISNIDQLESLLEKANYNGKLAIYLIKHKDQDIGFALSTNGSSGIITFKQTGQIAEDLFSYNSKEPERWYLPALSKALQDQSLNKITYNIKPLLKFFAELTEIKSVDDLQLMDYLLTAGLPKQDMFELANQHIKLEDIIADSINITSNFINSHTKLIKELSESNLLRLYEKIDLKIAYVLDAMEKCGVKLDQTYLKKLSKEFGEKLAKIEEEIFTTSGVQFNIASPKQLGEILFEKMQLPLGKISSKSKSYSTSAEVLEKLSEMGFEIADLLLKWRQLSKLKNTYTDTLPTQINNKTGRVHTTFLQASTTTGRLSSNDPNLQNIPIRSKEGSSIREAFIAEPGNNLISADYSQIELRILADIANVKALKQAFLANEDVHKATACKMFKLAEDEVSADHRRQAKAINFGIIYGQSSFGLAKQIGISNTEAANYIKQYFTEYPEIEEYMNNTKAYAKEHGFVKNLFGRKCNIQYIHDKNFALKQFAERAAINAPIQGANADIIKIAMINLDQEFSKLGLKTKMLLQIHDELLFEAPESEVKTVLPLIKTLMENAAHLSLPLVVEAKAGKNWAEIH
jgi:DNA polymerase-1